MKFKFSLLVVLATMLTTIAFSQVESTKPLDLIAQAKTNSQAFPQVDLFNIDLVTTKAVAGIESNIEAYDLFDIDEAALETVLREMPTEMTLEIPVNFKSNFELELVAVDIFSADFTVVQRSDNSVANVNTGLHYRGIIKGDENSVAAISFFGDEVMGLISSSEGNIVIGKLQNQLSDSKHIIYDDFNVITDLGLDCGTIDDGIGYKAKDLEFTESTKAVGDCIRLYIEVDKDIHDNKGGVTGATNFAAGLLNEVITLYANENIQAVVSQIVVWDVTSPYSSTSSSGMLSDFQANISSINGNLGQLLSYQASGGIAAGFSGICNSNVDNSLSFSSINSSYSTVPTYSWSVMVVTHEFGHLWGSRHTHACVWNGNNTAIDGCSGSTEGTCALPGYPSQGGTLMSYCHLQSVGINFNEGFGPQPGNVIRNSVNNASCTSPCGPATCDDGIQNQDETGVDCGGTSCPACPTCDDGMMNGDETGVDCGGSDCAPCPCLDNGVTLTINLDNYPEETSWIIRNSGGATVVSGGTYGSQPDGSTVVELACLPDGCYDFVIFDAYGDGICCGYGSGSYVLTDDSNGATLVSGGSFGSSETTNFCVGGNGPTCTDGIQNGNETDVDCGGPDCPACPTCNDGIQNGGETDVDCGGPDCPACPTCSDGIQNGDETGVDCGGSCPPCGGGECTNVTIEDNNFEAGWGIWNDGGSDCRRSSRDAAYANTGSYCVRLRDNTSTSTMTTDNLDLSAFEEVTINFNFYPRSMENGEDFWLQASTNGGSSYSTLISWASGTDFTNDVRSFQNIVITGTFTSNTRFRFRCDASGNSDYIYIDDVVITGCSNAGTNLPETGTNEITMEEEPIIQTEFSIGDLNLFPNPTRDQLSVAFTLSEDATIQLMVTDLSGKVVNQQQVKGLRGKVQTSIDASNYAPGVYMIHLVTSKGRLNGKFIVVD
jgi:hypothetical protein